MSKFKKLNSNYVLHGDGFYISYLPEGSDMFWFNPAETALVNKKSKVANPYYILNGDFRKDYEKIADGGYSVCKKFFNEKKKEDPELVSGWSH